MSKFTEFYPSPTPVGGWSNLTSAVIDQNFLSLQKTVTHIGQDLNRNQTTICDTTSGNLSYTLPAASSVVGHKKTYKKTVAANSVILNSPTDLIDGATSYTMTTQYDVVTVYSDGTTWWIV